MSVHFVTSALRRVLCDGRRSVFIRADLTRGAMASNAEIEFTADQMKAN